jgi:hypothetical protein
MINGGKRMIKLNKIGLIVNGAYKGWDVVIEEDNESYIVAYWSKEKNIGFDDWYENFEDLEKRLSFTIEWTDQDYISRQLSDDEKKRLEEFQKLAKKKGFNIKI